MDGIFKTTLCLKEWEIKSYFKNKEDIDLIKRVESHLVDCPLCSDAIEGFQAHYDFDKNNTLENLKTKVPDFKSDKKVEASVVKDQSTAKVFSLNRIAAAAMLLLLPVAGWMYYQNTVTKNTYAGLLEGSNEPIVAARSNDELDNLIAPLATAKKLYEKADYEASLAMCQSVLETSPENEMALFYGGIAALKAKQFKLADHYLSTLRINSTQFYEDATWYGLITKLEMDDKATAMKMLNELIEKDSRGYKAEALELKKTLE